MLKKIGVVLFVFVFIGQGALLAKASLRNTFERQLVNDIQTKLIKRYPTLVKKDISIRIKNKSQLQKIPITATTSPDRLP